MYFPSIPSDGTNMKILSTLQSWLLELHNYTDVNRMHHICFTWHGIDGLCDSHDLELRYTYNSECLALPVGTDGAEGNWLGSSGATEQARPYALMRINREIPKTMENSQECPGD